MTLSRIKLTDNLSAVETVFVWCVIGDEEGKHLSLCSIDEIKNTNQSIDLFRFWVAEGWSDPTIEEVAAQAIKNARHALKLINSRY